jgi:hypothetical protein
MRRAKPGEFIKRGSTLFEVTEIVDGHVWGNVLSSSIPGECCRICGMMRRRDNQNNPCKGPAQITLR